MYLKHVIAVGLTVFVLVGCQLSGGTTKNVRIPTLGTELKDLKEAHDTGAISDHEYTKLKQRLISRASSNYDYEDN